jgi:acetate kinase
VGSVLVVNAGSTSLKLHLVADDESSRKVDSLSLESERVDAVAHRVVHGSARFRDPVEINDAVRREIVELESIAPLHNAPALAGIDEAARALPDVPHIAVFDTAFHATILDEAAVYAVPRQWRDEWGVRRYGFHGLSVAWCAERVPALLERPTTDLKLVVCHLGGGCSVTAVRAGRSVDTTMGFSPLEGVPMTTRSGSIDPGALIYLLREHGLDVEQLDHALNFDSGLRGLAGSSGGMVELERRTVEGDVQATLGLDVFAHRVAAAVAAMAVACAGLDAVAFTAGIGENSSLARERICERLRFLGVALDRDRNAGAEPDCDIATKDSPVRVLVVRAREELVAAREARRLLADAYD